MVNNNLKGKIPEKLKTAIAERKCVLFVGAGLSAQSVTKSGSHPPLWAGLLEGMVDWCFKNDIPLQADRITFQRVIEQRRLLIVAQELQECLGNRLVDCLRDLLHIDEVIPSEAHLLIPAIDWAAVLTSNYDTLLEGAFTLYNKGRPIPKYTRQNTSEALKTLRNGKTVIFKVHGDIDLPQTVVLGQRDYAQTLYMEPAYRSFLESIFSTYTVLFIGVGPDDPDLNAIIERLSAVFEGGLDHHFILVSDKVFTPLEERRLLSDKQLKVITYESDSSHSQVLEFLKAIRPALLMELDMSEATARAPGLEDTTAVADSVGVTPRLMPSRINPSLVPFGTGARVRDQGKPVFVINPGRDITPSLRTKLNRAAERAGISLRYAEDAMRESHEHNDTRVPPDEVYSWEINMVTDSVLIVLGENFSSEELNLTVDIALYNKKPIALLQLGDVSVPGSISSLSTLKLSSDIGVTDEDALTAWLSGLK
jgi:hypothetical protein